MDTIVALLTLAVLLLIEHIELIALAVLGCLLCNSAIALAIVAAACIAFGAWGGLTALVAGALAGAFIIVEALQMGCSSLLRNLIY